MTIHFPAARAASSDFEYPIVSSTDWILRQRVQKSLEGFPAQHFYPLNNLPISHANPLPASQLTLLPNLNLLNSIQIQIQIQIQIPAEQTSPSSPSTVPAEKLPIKPKMPEGNLGLPNPENRGGRIHLRSPSFRGRRNRRSEEDAHEASLSRPGGARKRRSLAQLRQYRSSVDEGEVDLSGVKLGSKSVTVRTFESVVYGLVNSILTIPGLYGYAAIIYRAQPFQAEIDALSRLVLLSSVVHQVIFSLRSSLKFSIGQVQDAGLIFLSTMASSIAGSANSENILPTTVVTLSLSTFALGVVVYCVGRLRLATLVSYLPMPVVGGYLAFIGYFCFIAGLGLAVGRDIATLSDFSKLWDVEAAILSTPAVLGGLGLSLLSKMELHWLALPTAIIAMPCVFYAVVYFAGATLEDARNHGWINPGRF